MHTASDVHMFDLEIAPALRDFMANNICDFRDCMDWVCYTFDIAVATEFLFDRVADEYDAFFGN